MYAYNNKTSDPRYHGSKQRGNLVLTIYSNETISYFPYRRLNPPFFFVHAWFLWFSWGFISFFQIVSIRYMKPFFKIGKWFHIVGGVNIIVWTIVWSMMGIWKLNYTVSYHYHAKLGLILFAAVFLLAALGPMTLYKRTHLKWNTKQIIYVKNMHTVNYYNFHSDILFIVLWIRYHCCCLGLDLLWYIHVHSCP